MQTVHLLANHFLAGGIAPTIAPDPNSVTNVTTITSNIKTFLGPIVLLIISALSISFLMKKQLKKFIEFAMLTIAVGIFFYTPGIVENVARTIAGLFGGGN